MPAALKRAVAGNRMAQAGWADASYTHRKEWALAITGAKQSATRARRVAQVVEALERRGRRA
jgi:uncharacterized protein YdeI (YjbR/CyaY-like superfamily)